MFDKNEISAFPSHGTMGEVVEAGMTLRDYFAAKALFATIANESLVGNLTKGMTNKDADKAIAKHSYMLADAMLAAREAK